MSRKTFLITGGAGFIGSHFIDYFLQMYPEDRLINLDKLTYAGSQKNLPQSDRHKFILGDCQDKKLVEEIFKANSIRGVFHFAAETHVDNSIASPQPFIDSNINGTFTLLECARQFWMQAPYEPRAEFKDARFHYVSTDEVYGSMAAGQSAQEDTAYAPNSPYSASKASGDFLVRAWHKTYGLNTTVSHGSNTFGPRQHAEKLIPVILRNAYNEQSIPIYGDGKNERDWIYVQDHCRAIDFIFRHASSGEVFNVGGGKLLSNWQLAQTICQILDEKYPRKNGRKYHELLTLVKDRPGHDWRYALDTSKLQQLGWRAQTSFAAALETTIESFRS